MNRAPTMAYDSCDYPGSPWKGRTPGRSGHAIDKASISWVAGPPPAEAIEAETARRAAVFLATYPKGLP